MAVEGLPLGIVAGAALAMMATACLATDQWPAIPTENPYKADKKEYTCELLVVGGSSGGMGAAIAAGRLRLDTIYVLRAPRDVAGLLGCCMNVDSDLPMRHLGGVPVELDLVARRKSGLDYSKMANHGAGFSAPSHVYFDYVRTHLESFKTLRIIADYYPVAVEKDIATNRVKTVRFRHRKDASNELAIRPRVTIDAEVEGDVMALAGVSWTLKREGRHPDDDPTRDNETYAGKLFMRRYKATRENVVLPESTHEADTVNRTMAWNAILVLKGYPKQGASETSRWMLKNPPAGYDQIDPEAITNFSGIAMGGDHTRSLAHRTLSYIEGWKMPDGRHVLESMDLKDREENEKKHLLFALSHLYKLQHVLGKVRTGISDDDAWVDLPAKYTLKDFGTETYGGDMPLPSLIYMREGRRMLNDHIFGGKLIEDDGSGVRVQRRSPNPRAAFFNAMLIDHHPVTNEYAKNDHSQPEGWMLLRMGGLHDFGTPPIPYDVFIPRESEATDLLVANAGAFTHEAYAAFPRMEPGRVIQGNACAVLAYHAIKDRTPVHQTDPAKAQLTGLLEHGLSIVYQPDSFAGTQAHVIDQMLGARGVPAFDPKNVFADENTVTRIQALAHMNTLGLAETSDLGAVDRPLSLSQALAALDLEARPLDADRPIRLSVWKRLLFNAVFPVKYGVEPARVNLAKALAWDTFSRTDGDPAKAESGSAYASTGKWMIEGGAIHSEADKVRREIWTSVESAIVAVSCDLYLEQTTSGAAGIVIRDADTKAALRLILAADDDKVSARVEMAPVDGAPQIQERPLGAPLKRGFHLDVAVSASGMEIFVDGQPVMRVARPPLGTRIEAGLVNEPGISSWFDNFEVRSGWQPMK